MTDQDHIAQCQICTIAPALRACLDCRCRAGLRAKIAWEREVSRKDEIMRRILRPSLDKITRMYEQILVSELGF